MAKKAMCRKFWSRKTEAAKLGWTLEALDRGPVLEDEITKAWLVSGPGRDLVPESLIASFTSQIQTPVREHIGAIDG